VQEGTSNGRENQGDRILLTFLSLCFFRDPLYAWPMIAEQNRVMSGKFANEREVSVITGIAVKTLQRWRLLGQGPKWKRLGGAIRYDRADLEEWIRQCPGGGGVSHA
jgi:predicted DNA-binding transcriptional regulator AlpA